MMAVRYHGCTCHMRYGGVGVGTGRGGVRGGDSNGSAGKDSYDGCGGIGGDKEAGAEDRDTDEDDKGKNHCLMPCQNISIGRFDTFSVLDFYKINLCAL